MCTFILLCWRSLMVSLVAHIHKLTTLLSPSPRTLQLFAKLMSVAKFSPRVTKEEIDRIPRRRRLSATHTRFSDTISSYYCIHSALYIYIFHGKPLPRNPQSKSRLDHRNPAVTAIDESNEPLEFPES